jgi:predicted NBD/HSP70 family sugar kinase
MDHAEMRQHNTRKTLGVLYREGTSTLAALHRASGLSRRTLELILAELLELGWALERSPEADVTRSVGRPARTFAFNYDAASILTIQLEIDHIRLTVANLAADVIGQAVEAVPQHVGRTERLKRVEAGVRALLARAGVPLEKVLAATVSTLGVVGDDGSVDSPHGLSQWRGFSLRDEISTRLGCSVRVENDAKLAAIGEKAGRDDDIGDFIYLFAERDMIGAGIIIRNELHRGRSGAAGELARTRTAGSGGATSLLLRAIGDPLSPDHERANAVIAAARRGDDAALAEINAIADSLLPTVLTASWLLDPHALILGGTFGLFQDLIVPAFERALSNVADPTDVQVLGSRFGREAVLMGCLQSCVDLVEDIITAQELPAFDTSPA